MKTFHQIMSVLKKIAKKTTKQEEVGIWVSLSISESPRQCPINSCQIDLGEQSKAVIGSGRVKSGHGCLPSDPNLT